MRRRTEVRQTAAATGADLGIRRGTSGVLGALYLTESGIVKDDATYCWRPNHLRRCEMTEKVKKTKAPAKQKATAETTKKVVAKKETVVEKVIRTTPTHAEIALLALQYWAERGRQHGQDQADWLRAEQELMSMAS
jgi:hypothetical protein